MKWDPRAGPQTALLNFMSVIVSVMAALRPDVMGMEVKRVCRQRLTSHLIWIIKSCQMKRRPWSHMSWCKVSADTELHFWNCCCCHLWLPPPSANFSSPNASILFVSISMRGHARRPLSAICHHIMFSERTGLCPQSWSLYCWSGGKGGECGGGGVLMGTDWSLTSVQIMVMNYNGLSHMFHSDETTPKN